MPVSQWTISPTIPEPQYHPRSQSQRDSCKMPLPQRLPYPGKQVEKDQKRMKNGEEDIS